MKSIVLSIFALAILSFAACDENDDVGTTGKLTLHFNHLVNDQNIEFDQMVYANSAGNVYEITEIQWFISDVTLVDSDGQELLLDDGSFAHYIDTNLPETMTWELPDEVPSGDYTNIKITFGIKGEKNIPYSFPNPPESDMQWPYHMGGDYGGYHYMKLNGFWMNVENERTPFNFHLGVGQEYDNDGNITGYIQNWFEVVLPSSDILITPGNRHHLILRMGVENWFQNPHIYNHDTFGGKIMNNQEAMGMISDNGRNVFSVEIMDTDEGKEL